MSPRKKAQPKPKGPLTVQKMINALKMCPNKNAIVTVGDRDGFSPERINKVCFIYGDEKKVDEVLLYGMWAWSNGEEDEEGFEGAPYGEETSRDIAQAVACAIADGAACSVVNKGEDCMELGPALTYLPKEIPDGTAAK